MNPAISPLEIQLIKSSLTTKTDEEIAELLEIPVEDVIDFINEFTDGGAADRHADILKLRDELQQEKKKKRIRDPLLVEKEKKLEERRLELAKRRNLEEKRIVQRNQWNDRRTYKSRAQEFEKMISVKVDRKTWILVKPGTDIEKAKQQYLNNHK